MNSATAPGESKDRGRPSGPSGVLVVDKPYRLSSTSIVSVVKGRLRAGGASKSVKVGHGGTLDPLASGVLVVLVGRATKTCDRIMAGRKTYVASIDLSHRSDTDDLEGRLEPVVGAPSVRREDVEAVLARFVGRIEQVPPRHSAVWVNGKRAYELARKQRDFALASREVVIERIEIEEFAFPMLTISVRCGKGVYIRSLARDVGQALTGGGVLSALRRTRVEPFGLEHAVTLDSMPAQLRQEDLLALPEDPLIEAAESTG